MTSTRWVVASLFLVLLLFLTPLPSHRPRLAFIRVANQRLFSHHNTLKPAGRRHQSFIPEDPDQMRPGQPADVPRTFLIEEEDACQRNGDDLQVVAYVHSAISRVEQRRQTRLTWANISAHNPALRMIVVFMVGRARTSLEQNILIRESSLHHDIVQGDYSDHYKLLSYKALNALYWITRNCAHVPWTLHSDDDLLIDTFLLHQFIQQHSSSKDQLHCKEMREPVQRKGKWKVSLEMQKTRYYPPFCQGALWLLPTEQVPKLIQASVSVKFLWVDDVYVTGFLAGRANISINDISNLMGNIIVTSKDIGKKLAWFHLLFLRRSQVWPRILAHHHALQNTMPV